MSASAAAAGAVVHALRAALASIANGRPPAVPVRVAVALSGGRDSMVLLDALATLAPEHGIELTAVHVHHGLSPAAEAWTLHCSSACARRAVPLTIRRVNVRRAGGESLEAAARRSRYEAFASVDADYLALAHHADDQAETLLLQLLRGAGPQGLAAMPLERAPPAGPVLARPFLGLPRAAIEGYAAAHGLLWVDDDSNADTRLKRNFVRHEIAPRLAAAFPGYPATLVRAARHQAEAALLLDELASDDARGTVVDDPVAGPTLERAALVALAARAPHRARNLLRWFLRQHALPAPSAARLAAMLAQLTEAAADARVRLAHAGTEIGIHRDRIVVHAPAVAPFAVAWRGEALLPLPHGTLEFVARTGAGVAREALDSLGASVRSRAGGERLRLAGDRPRRALKVLLQEAGMPPWQRASLPLVFCGDALAVVPGIGVDTEFQAEGRAPGFDVRWHPGERARRARSDPPPNGGKG